MRHLRQIDIPAASEWFQSKKEQWSRIDLAVKEKTRRLEICVSSDPPCDRLPAVLLIDQAALSSLDVVCGTCLNCLKQIAGF